MKWVATLAVITLAGCGGMRAHQASCEARTARFVDFAGCYRTEVLADSRTAGDPRAKLLLLRMDQMADRVRSGLTSDAEARIEFQQLFVTLRSEALREAAATAPASGSTTDCQAYGSRVICNSF